MVGAIVFQWMSFVWVITGWLTCEVDVLTLLVQCHRGCGEWIQRAHPLPPSPSYSSPPPSFLFQVAIVLSLFLVDPACCWPIVSMICQGCCSSPSWLLPLHKLFPCSSPLFSILGSSRSLNCPELSPTLTQPSQFFLHCCCPHKSWCSL